MWLLYPFCLSRKRASLSMNAVSDFTTIPTQGFTFPVSCYVSQHSHVAAVTPKTSHYMRASFIKPC